MTGQSIQQQQLSKALQIVLVRLMKDFVKTCSQISGRLALLRLNPESVHEQEERTQREAVEQKLEEEKQRSQGASVQLQQSLQGEIETEKAEHAATKKELQEALQQLESLKNKAAALNAQLQASAITTQQRASQFDRQKAELEVSCSSLSSYLVRD